jgi:hypothetical protein
MTDEARAAFWAWWADTRDRLDEAIRRSEVGDALVADIGDHVEALPPGGLAWELTPGEEARHALVVTAGGDPELRAAAERWRRSAPPADATWEYRSTRPASLDAMESALTFDGVEVDLAELTVTWEVDERRREVDVRVHHPAFSEGGEELRNQVTFLALDWLLGEEDVERFVGAIEPVADPPPGARPLRELAPVVAGLDADAADWVILEARPEGRPPTMVSAMARLKPVDHPLLDTHAAVVAQYETEHPDGYPDGDELTRLRELEDGLDAALGDDGRLVAHASSEGTRVLHAYFDGESAAGERLERWAAERGVALDVRRDPAWDAVRHFR